MNIDHFFSEYKGNKIALYGLGTETMKVLSQFEKNFKIIGLLDGFREDGELYGKPIISFDDVIKNKVKLIIVVARPGSCKAITKRIGEICKINNISLMDIRGENLLKEKNVVYDLKELNGITRTQLLEKVQNADIVSFDMFDTLVMRQTLYAEDVINYVDSKLKENGYFLYNFCKKRLQCEKELSRCMAPTLIEIYKEMLKKLKYSDVGNDAAEKLALLEWKIDFGLMIPRRDVCEIFNEAVKRGKSVYIVSDTYYSKKQLIEILKKCKIIGYKDILASSEYGTSKQQELYAVLKKKEYGKRYLHIGDDIVADIECAEKYGFDTCQVMNAADLLEAVGNLGFNGYMNTMADRLKIGLFAARIFNSPFQFEVMDRQITISNAYDLGYLIFAPVICDFVVWFYEKIKNQKFQNIWFCARDGYLIEKMYTYLAEVFDKKDETVYFLTSRIAAIRAGVRNEKDILYVDSMKFSGTLEENLSERFGIDANSIGAEDIAENEIGLMRYKKSIIGKAITERQNYTKYIDSLNIKDGDIAFFDFVAKGTSQMYIQRMIPNHLKGFYFLQLEPEYMKDKNLDIQSFYTEDSNKKSAIFEEYYILETFLTSKFPSVTGFDNNGRPIYASETRKNKDIQCLQWIQEGIFDYFKSYIKLYPNKQIIISRKLDEILLEMIYKVRITDIDFLEMVIEDPFFHRMTDIADVL